MSTEIRTIRKYPNRRLYDTASSTYVTLQDVKQLVQQEIPVRIVDARSQADLTHSILMQILQEEEAAGPTLLSQTLLVQLIRAYGGAMQSQLGDFLERSLQYFLQTQEEQALLPTLATGEQDLALPHQKS